MEKELLEKSLSHADYRLFVVTVFLSVLFFGMDLKAASIIGGESGAYLRYPVGATGLAMGGAETALPQAAAPWWNPAVLVRDKSRQATAGVGIRSLGQTDAALSLEFPVPPRLAMGFLLLYRGDPFLDQLYDENENPLEPASYTTFTGKITFSYMVTRKLSAGCNISVFYERLPDGYTDGVIHYTSATSIGSLDFALSYRWSDKLHLAAVLRDAGATMNWSFSSYYGYSTPYDDRFTPVIILAGSYAGSLQKKPFIWNLDLRGNLFDGKWNKLDHPQLTVNTGCEWRYWNTIALRAGLGDIALNRYFSKDNEYYRNNFHFRFTGGIAYNLERFRPGLKCNYGFSTDKIWAGIDQQLDITYTF